jgi:hypothetical protein
VKTSKRTATQGTRLEEKPLRDHDPSPLEVDLSDGVLDQRHKPSVVEREVVVRDTSATTPTAAPSSSKTPSPTS